jgi:hypothetical protein
MGKKNEAIVHLTRALNSEPAWYQDKKLKQECERLLQSLVP